MFERISIENFKSFLEKQEINLAPITLIYGPNSSGKSSIIQTLVLLKQSLTRPSEQGGLVSNGEYIDLGNYVSMINGHDKEKDLNFTLHYKPKKRQNEGTGLRYLFGSAHEREYALTYSLSGKNCQNQNEEFTYLKRINTKVKSKENRNLIELNLISALAKRDSGEFRSRSALAKKYIFVDEKSRDEVSSFIIKKVDATNNAAMQNKIIKEFNDISFSSDLSFATPSSTDLEGTLAEKKKQSLAVAVTNIMLSELSKELQEKFNAISYLGPLRSHPSRFYAPKGDQSGTVGKAGEHAARLIYEKSPEITETINRWFKEFEIPYSLSVKSIGTDISGSVICLQLEDHRTGVIVGPSDVGFGIGQLLPIIVEGIVRTESTICVEQPEIHLHPKLQANLANFIIETSTNNQWIIETHSEALLLRIQKKIRTGKISPDKISIIYVEPTKLGGSILTIPLDKDGDFTKEWPEGFFEERFNETFGD
ncbi:Protein of unknown function [Pseudomonas citronellolis]|uniref:Endonuclease GajA/Old nuclease/RecF-like AAA domain-containing protein n=1 Tax=Pseudomonas citronellolis TaxID=53408 RepID=A0AAQ1HRD2_9PSED|nr:DUF3696 domain-containing protein [Pseudomonas citronellolis]TGC20873.1 DUF3696 domain-containing protein [Pseudomonas citronellolis]SFD35491.1 Protein of unknown function [Pseudomonas citronellolis]